MEKRFQGLSSERHTIPMLNTKPRWTSARIRARSTPFSRKRIGRRFVSRASDGEGKERETNRVAGYDIDAPSLLESEAVGIAIQGVAVIAVGTAVFLAVKLSTPVIQVVEATAPKIDRTEFVAIR